LRSKNWCLNRQNAKNIKKCFDLTSIRAVILKMKRVFNKISHLILNTIKKVENKKWPKRKGDSKTIKKD
jgi:hypothetical protein